MPATPQKQLSDYATWPSKQQVAEILDVSTKTVEKLATAGKLHLAYWKRPAGGPKISVYHPVDVENLRREMFPGTPSTFVMPAPSETISLPPEKSESTAEKQTALQAMQPRGELINRFLEMVMAPPPPGASPARQLGGRGGLADCGLLRGVGFGGFLQ